MKTKDKILHQGLSLFNESGVDQVSALEISQSLGISYGNLTYHFTRKDEIVLTLYTQMQEELDASMANLVEHLFAETYYLKLVNELFEIVWKYRFIYLNINSLMNQFESIRQAEKSYLLTRKKILNKAKILLIKEGYLHPEVGENYQRVIQNLNIVLTAWIIDAKLFSDGSITEKITSYASLFYSIALTHATNKGHKRYQQLIDHVAVIDKAIGV
jgi:AcrR family transcriptional regulator